MLLLVEETARAPTGKLRLLRDEGVEPRPVTKDHRSTLCMYHLLSKGISLSQYTGVAEMLAEIRNRAQHGSLEPCRALFHKRCRSAARKRMSTHIPQAQPR